MSFKRRLKKKFKNKKFKRRLGYALMPATGGLSLAMTPKGRTMFGKVAVVGAVAGGTAIGMPYLGTIAGGISKGITSRQAMLRQKKMMQKAERDANIQAELEIQAQQQALRPQQGIINRFFSWLRGN